MEPTQEVIQSGQCQVPVCADIDLGNYSFRYYAPDRTTRIRFIPKGACQCQKIRRINTYNSSSFKMEVETRDGKLAPNVSALRVFPPDHPRANSANITTWDRYSRTKAEFEEISDFQFDGDSFSSFRVFRSRYSRADAVHDYFFVPRSVEFNFPGRTQPIAFNIPFGHPRYSKDGKVSLTVNGDVKLAEGVHFFQFFYPRLNPSDEWVASMERSAEVIDARLFPK